MANYNIEMNMLNNSGGYDVLYPKVDIILNKYNKTATSEEVSLITINTSTTGYTTGSNVEPYGYVIDNTNFGWDCDNWTITGYGNNDNLNVFGIFSNIVPFYLVHADGYFTMKKGTLLKDEIYYINITGLNNSSLPTLFAPGKLLSGNIYNIEANRYSDIFKQADMSIIIESSSNFRVKIKPYENIKYEYAKTIPQFRIRLLYMPELYTLP